MAEQAKSHKARNAAIGAAGGSLAIQHHIGVNEAVFHGGMSNLRGEHPLAQAGHGIKGYATAIDPRFLKDVVTGPGKYKYVLGGGAAAGAGAGALIGRKRNSNIPDGAKRGKRL